MVLGTLLLLILIVGSVALIGWTLNLVKLCRCDFEPSYRAEIIRGIGVFVAPVGVITGWMEIPDVAKE